MGQQVRGIRADEWQAVKELRLAALQDPVAHLAFLESYEEGVAKADSFWQERAHGGAEGDGAVRQFVAEGEDGRWIGTVTVLVEEPGVGGPFGSVVEQRQGHLVAVYIRPEHRGRGVLDALFEAALKWSWSRGLERVRLLVHERNGRAQQAYRKAGFVVSGQTTPVPGDAESREIEMVWVRGDGRGA
ncbi:GNAT family N-acetyltransferase [Streptomyces sp. NPDC058045]|uniref:GNAT family N-acetyltransferase n=1 Tax=Streptomyces sp. NPDC058045 TaxID=3346311 RepID=UPI0036F11AD1